MTQRAPKNLNTTVNRPTRVENTPRQESTPVKQHSATVSSAQDPNLSQVEEISIRNTVKTSETSKASDVSRTSRNTKSLDDIATLDNTRTSNNARVSGNAKSSDAANGARSSSARTKISANTKASSDARTSVNAKASSGTRTSKKSTGSKKSKTGIISIIIIVVAAAVFIFAAIKLISAITTYSTADSSYEEVREIFKVTEDKDVTKATEIVTNEEGSTVVKEVEWVFDYDKLLALNSDAIGYLKMQGGGDDIVDYPVVQGYDNDYYLDHLFDGTYNNSGAIFMDCNAVDGFNSSYAIIYGHNMRSGARMFGCLHGYRDYDYFEKHMLWDVYTGYEKHVYRTFASFETSVDSFVYDYYTSDNITYLAENALINADYGMGLTIDDFSSESKILCLSTCLDDYSDYYRYVVFLVRIS